MLITINGLPVPVATIAKGEGAADRILTFDLQKAWMDMALKAGWANEVEVVLRL